MRKFTFVSAIIVAFQFLLLQIVIACLMVFIGQQILKLKIESFVILPDVMKLLSGIILLIIYSSKGKFDARSIFRFREFNFQMIVAAFLIVIGGFIIFSGLSNHIVDILNVKENSASTGDEDNITPFFMLMIIIFVTIISPAIEEIVFRGIIFGNLAKTYNWFVALLVSSLIFSLMHGIGIGLQMFLTFFSGILYGLFFLKTESMPLTIMCHQLHNIMVFVFGYMARHGSSGIVIKNGSLHFGIIYTIIGFAMLVIGFCCLLLRNNKNNLKCTNCS